VTFLVPAAGASGCAVPAIQLGFSQFAPCDSITSGAAPAKNSSMNSSIVRIM
jgi:hypothetical protein